MTEAENLALFLNLSFNPTSNTNFNNIAPRYIPPMSMPVTVDLVHTFTFSDPLD